MREIRKPEFIKEARVKKGHSLLLEMIIGFVLFLVGSIAVGIIQVPAVMAYILQNKGYMFEMLRGSVSEDSVSKIIENMPPWLTGVSLLAEVGLILIYFLYCRLLEKRKAVTMGFSKKKAGRKYLAGIGIGIVTYGVTYGICLISGSVSFVSESSANFTWVYAVLFLAGFAVQGLAEEVICRGYLLVSLARNHSVWVSIITSAAFFSLLHTSNNAMSFLSYINLLLFGIVMGLLFVRYESIWLVAAFHSAWNFIQGNIFGVSVSGTGNLPSLFTNRYNGQTLINGGAFGTEGGLAVTLVLLVTAFVVWKSLEKKGRLMTGQEYVQETKKEWEEDCAKYGNPFGNVNMPQDFPMGQESNSSTANGNEAESRPESRTESNLADNPEPVMATENRTQEKKREDIPNMGLNPQETPWYPEQKEESTENKMTPFNQSYFKED